MNCSSDLKNFANSWSSASNFKSFSRSLEQFFLTVDQNNFGNKIPNQPVLERRVDSEAEEAALSASRSSSSSLVPEDSLLSSTTASMMGGAW